MFTPSLRGGKLSTFSLSAFGALNLRSSAGRGEDRSGDYSAGDLLNFTVIDLAIAATDRRACNGRRYGAGACPAKSITDRVLRCYAIRGGNILPLNCLTLHWSRWICERWGDYVRRVWNRTR
jgi:hypothetical protein